MKKQFTLECQVSESIAGIPTIGINTVPSPIPEVAYEGIKLFVERFRFFPNTMVANPAHRMLLEIFIGGDPYCMRVISEPTFQRNEFAFLFIADEELSAFESYAERVDEDREIAACS